jgi:polar amino acid transport system substrate-binding protein
MGVDLVITDMTFDTMSPALNAGKIDIAIANFFKYEEREKYFVFSDPYMTGDVAVLVRKE